MRYNLLKNVTSIMGFAIPIISELCIFVDWAIYAIASFTLQTFYKIAELSAYMFVDVGDISAMETVNSILSRVMVLAGVFALFRLGIMLINYLISPENTKKAGQTGTDFIKSIMLAVILLAASKTIFSQLGKFQYLIINGENNIIPKLVYGTKNFDSGDVPVTYSNEEEADMFTNRVWSLFFQPNDNATNGSTVAWEEVRSGNASIVSMVGRNYNEFDYYPFISGIVGMMLIYYFAIFSVELGARVIKLVVLQVLSPIPIIMSIDPSSKNKLSNFCKSYIAIYLQIFVRVITIYLAFVILDLLQKTLNEVLDGSTMLRIMSVQNFIIDVVLIFAVFQAAKELPKVIEDALGLKLGIQTSGKGSFASLVGGIVGGTVGAVGGGVAGFAGAKGSGFASTLGASLMGIGSGMIQGGSAGSRGKSIAEKVSGVSGAIRNSHRTGDIISDVGGIKNYAKAKIDANTGYLSRLDRNTQKAEDQMSLYKNFEEAVYSDYAKQKIDGQKVGNMENDSAVYNAQLQLDKYRQDVMMGNINPDEDERHRLLNELKKAQDSWKDRAFEWFARENLVDTQQAVDQSGAPVLENGRPLEMVREDAPKVKYDPTNYAGLSDSQRAHHDITRASRGEAFLPDLEHDARRRVGMPQGYESSQFRKTFKNRYDKIEDRTKDLKAEKQSDKSRNAQKAMSPKGSMSSRYFGGPGGPSKK